MSNFFKKVIIVLSIIIAVSFLWYLKNKPNFSNLRNNGLYEFENDKI